MREHVYSRKEGGREPVSAVVGDAVVPAQAGTHIPESVVMGPRVRGDDGAELSAEPSHLFSIAARTRATVSAGVRETCSTSAVTSSPDKGSTSILSLSASAR